MKTITIILTTLFILQVNSLFSNNDGVPVKSIKEMNFSTVLISAPVTPKEATFEETGSAAEIFILTPVTPKEAPFEEETEEISISGLAPVTPAEADFSDSEYSLDPDLVSMAPVTPAEADFTELP